MKLAQAVPLLSRPRWEQEAIKPRIASSAALFTMLLGWFSQSATVLLLASHLSRHMFRSHLLSWPPLMEHSVSRQELLWFLHCPTKNESTPVRGRALLLNPVRARRCNCFLLLYRNSCAAQSFVPGPLSPVASYCLLLPAACILSQLTSCAYRPVVSLSRCFGDQRTVTGSLLRSTSLDCFKTGPGQELFEPSSPII
jgi:hypothetical protein